MSRLAVVTGATGAQGGSVVNALLKDGTWKVRGLTRDPNSEKAKELKQKGVDVVKCDVSNRDEVEHAFKGAYAVFAVTNFWDKDIYPNNKGKEEEQGKLMADVAKAEGVKHYIWSSLHDAQTISGGKIELLHFSGKNRVEQYIRKIGLPATYLNAGFYASNFSSFFPPKVINGVAEFQLAFTSATKIAIVDISDTGAVVVAILNAGKDWIGKKVNLAGEYITPDKLAEDYTKVTGQPAKFIPVPLDQFAKFAPAELVENMAWMNEYGLFNGEDISDARKLYPKIKTWEDFLRSTGWKAK